MNQFSDQMLHRIGVAMAVAGILIAVFFAILGLLALVRRHCQRREFPELALVAPDGRPVLHPVADGPVTADDEYYEAIGLHPRTRALLARAKSDAALGREEREMAEEFRAATPASDPKVWAQVAARIGATLDAFTAEREVVVTRDRTVVLEAAIAAAGAAGGEPDGEDTLYLCQASDDEQDRPDWTVTRPRIWVNAWSLQQWRAKRDAEAALAAVNGDHAELKARFEAADEPTGEYQLIRTRERGTGRAGMRRLMPAFTTNGKRKAGTVR